MRHDSVALAWVESPLQLLCAVEYAAATSARVTIVPRTGALQLASTAAELRTLGLPDNVRITEPRSSPAPWFAAHRGHWIVGDVYSGHVRAALAVSRPGRLTIVDDGLSTSRLDAVLSGVATLERPGRAESLAVRTIASLARKSLIELEARNEIELFSCWMLRHNALVSNSFAWLRSRSTRGAARSGTIVVGSAAVADRLVAESEYLAWLAAFAPEGTYLPHRRETDASLARIAQATRLTVERPSLPIELELAGSRNLTITGFGSSALTTLTRVLAGSGATVIDAPNVREAEVAS